MNKRFVRSRENDVLAVDANGAIVILECGCEDECNSYCNRFNEDEEHDQKRANSKDIH